MSIEPSTSRERQATVQSLDPDRLSLAPEFDLSIAIRASAGGTDVVCATIDRLEVKAGTNGQVNTVMLNGSTPAHPYRETIQLLR